MRIKTLALITAVLIHGAAAGICSSHSVIPFSGYKVTRRHKVRIRPLKSDSFLVLTKCHRGIPLFTRTVRSLSVRDEFSMPFCDSHTEFDFSRTARTSHKPFFPQSTSWSQNQSVSTAGSIKKRDSHSIQVKDARLKGWFGSFLENLMESSATNPHTDTVAASTTKKEENARSFPNFRKKEKPETSVSDLGPAPCMKLARRKRYARSNVVIFIPATFVGALFMCSDIDETSHENAELATASIIRKTEVQTQEGWPKLKKAQKRRRVLTWVDESDDSPSRKGGVLPRPSPKDLITMSLEKNPTSDFLRQTEEIPSSEPDPDPEQDPFHFEGNAVCPLVADDYSSHWVSVQFSPPAIIYHVPYLRSPSIWDPRFKSSLSHGSSNWDQDIDINEAYSYTRKELNRIGEALTHSRKYITRLFVSKRTRLSSILALRKRWIQKFDPRLQFSLILSSFKKPATLNHVIKLQRIWDKLPHSDANADILG